ncbi:hypothetical protein EF912_02315 [Streptomyces sp. WAC07061]|uniref:hypothetical protein n=1 Tax=Streptomyces sp. WAC07061 TaxID=2487410 RepID=UPI000F791006|nr:hypothetical protein [Streptomyces sp. WAC07061]RSS64109.1 hypothetical protein EF912_02315 [Streptomyces sp. WAC07061]
MTSRERLLHHDFPSRVLALGELPPSWSPHGCAGRRGRTQGSRLAGQLADARRRLERLSPRDRSGLPTGVRAAFDCPTAGCRRTGPGAGAAA